MSRRKQSRPVKVLDDGSEEECAAAGDMSPMHGDPGAVVIVNGHHVSTSTRRRFDDGEYRPLTAKRGSVHREPN